MLTTADGQLIVFDYWQKNQPTFDSSIRALSSREHLYLSPATKSSRQIEGSAAESNCRDRT